MNMNTIHPPNQRRYLGAGIACALAIGASVLAFQGGRYAVTTVGSEIKTAYQKINGTYVPLEYVQPPEPKTPSRLEEVIQHGEWQFSNGMRFTLEQTDEGINNHYLQYIPDKIQGDQENPK